MAKLHNYYVLCPLIDQNSFLGVSRDKDDENVIVTLGRNVVNKYRLSDQKQISGWTSKDHLTSMVIYSKDINAYVGVFNRNTIKIWEDELETLDKIKKYKFPVNIFKLIPRDEQPSLLIFENGNCASLSYALDNRKTYESKLFLKESDTIVDTACYKMQNTEYICYVTKNNKDCYNILTCPLREELGDMQKSKINKIRVSRKEEVYVVGELISATENPSIYFLWNDAKMTVYNLEEKSWKTIGTVPWVSTLSCVSIAWMGKDHLILFGSNIEQDGAIIVAYNIILGVGSCRYQLKMYSENAKLYCYNNRIILEASNHIGMLPYVLEENRNLSSLLGSHEITDNDCTEIVNWDTPVEPLYNVSKEIKELLKVGVTERRLCAQVISTLLEKDDIRSIFKIITEFNDVPESVLILLLQYAIKLLNPENSVIVNDENFLKFCNTNHKGFKLLKYLFQITFSDAMLIPYLRDGLSLDDALFLLNYICYLLVDINETMGTVYENKLFDWCTLLIDAFYQQYLLTKDEKVSYVLNNVNKVVGNLIDQLTVINNTLPLLQKMISGKLTDDGKESLPYTIELIEI